MIVGILLYTRVVRVFPELQGLMKVMGILLYTRVVECVILKTMSVLLVILNKMRDSRCHSERSEESLGV